MSKSRRAIVRAFHKEQRIQFTFSPAIYHVVIVLASGIARLAAGIQPICHRPFLIQLHHHPPGWSMGGRCCVYDPVTPAVSDMPAAKRREVRDQMHNAGSFYFTPCPCPGAHLSVPFLQLGYRCPETLPDDI